MNEAIQSVQAKALEVDVVLLLVLLGVFQFVVGLIFVPETMLVGTGHSSGGAQAPVPV